MWNGAVWYRWVWEGMRGGMGEGRVWCSGIECSTV